MAARFETIRIPTTSGDLTLPSGARVCGFAALPTGYAIAFVYDTTVTGTETRTFVALNDFEVADFITSDISEGFQTRGLVFEQDTNYAKTLVVLS